MIPEISSAKDLNCIDSTCIRILESVCSGKSAARDIIEKTLEPLQKVRSIPLLSGGEGEDIDEWIKGGVPGGSIKTDPDKYFKFHHTNGKDYL